MKNSRIITIRNKTSSDDSSTAVQEQQNLSEISLEEFELNLNTEAGFVDLDDELFDDLMQEIENVSNSTQYLLDDNALSVAMCLTTNCGDTIPNWVNVGV